MEQTALTRSETRQFLDDIAIDWMNKDAEDELIQRMNQYLTKSQRLEIIEWCEKEYPQEYADTMKANGHIAEEE